MVLKRFVHLDRFLTRSRVRWIVWRMLEHAALGLAAATIVGLILMPIFFVRRQPALPVVAALMGFGAILGAVSAFRRVPSRLDVAMQLDRQLHLSDLIASAALLLHRDPPSSDPWRDAVIASADERVRSIAPRELILQRLGLRAWGGVGLGGAMAVTLALLQGNPRNSLARSDAPIASQSIKASAAPSRPGAVGNLTRADSTQPQARSSAEPRSPDASQIADQNASSPAAPVNASKPNSSDASGSRGSSGSSRTPTPPNKAPRSPEREPNVAPDPNSRYGAPSTGAGRTMSAMPGNDIAGSGTAVSPSTAPPPWTIPTWADDRAAALRQVDSGDVPDACRDLVQMYFER